MLIGLPGSGKTYWATEYCRKHASHNYYVIGVASVLEKMRVMKVYKKQKINFQKILCLFFEKMLGLKKKPSSNELCTINSLQCKSASKVSNDLLDKTFKCVSILTEIAAQAGYRNVILDQTNAYASSRRRKLKI